MLAIMKGGTTCFHLLKEGGGDVLPCLEERRRKAFPFVSPPARLPRN